MQKTSQSHLDELSDIDWGDDDYTEPTRYSEEPENWDQYIEDNLEDEGGGPGEEIVPEDEEEIIEFDDSNLEPTQEYVDINQLLTDSMGEPPHVIKFDYTTRHGRFTSDRGVEPHRIFTAGTTGNEILLTYDRSVGGIRGFIIGNIKPFGVMYKNTFERQPYIMQERMAPAQSRPVEKRRS